MSPTEKKSINESARAVRRRGGHRNRRRRLLRRVSEGWVRSGGGVAVASASRSARRTFGMCWTRVSRMWATSSALSCPSRAQILVAATLPDSTIPPLSDVDGRAGSGVEAHDALNGCSAKVGPGVQQRKPHSGHLAGELRDLAGFAPAVDSRDASLDGDGAAPVLRVDDRDTACTDNQMIDVTPDEELHAMNDQSTGPQPARSFCTTSLSATAFPADFPAANSGVRSSEAR